MSDNEKIAREEELSRLCKTIFILEEELRKDLSGPDYLQKWRKLNEAKSRYKDITGIYPVIPDHNVD